MNTELSNEDILTPIFAAAQEGYLEMVLLLASGGVNIDALDYYGKTPLCFAAERGQVGLATLLANRGAKLDVVPLDGTTAICGAVHGGHLEILAMLADRGVGIYKHFYLAIMIGKVDVVKALLDRARYKHRAN